MSENKLEITQKNIDELDANKLRDNVLKGFFVLENYMFAQASQETNRMEKYNTVLDDLEDYLFNDEALQFLSFEDKLDLYKTISTNKNNTLRFFRDLHRELENSLSMIDHIEVLKNRKGIETNPKKPSPELEKVKKQIKERIALKVKEAEAAAEEETEN